MTCNPPLPPANKTFHYRAYDGSSLGRTLRTRGIWWCWNLFCFAHRNLVVILATGKRITRPVSFLFSKGESFLATPVCEQTKKQGINEWVKVVDLLSFFFAGEIFHGTKGWVFWKGTLVHFWTSCDQLNGCFTWKIWELLQLRFEISIFECIFSYWE